MEHDESSRERKRVDDPAAAAVVLDPAARRYLAPFLGRERRVSDVARELGADMSAVLYRVRQFLRLGLLEVARVEPRRGRAVRYYRSVAKRFFVPFGATTLAAQEALSPQTFAELQQALNESIGAAWTEAAGDERPLGVHVFRGRDDAVLMDVVPDGDDEHPSDFFTSLLESDAPAVWDTWGSISLAPEDAKALQREIASLVGRYRRSGDGAPGEREYLLRLAMAPRKA
jgi:hypothetical protein